MFLYGGCARHKALAHPPYKNTPGNPQYIKHESAELMFCEADNFARGGARFRKWVYVESVCDVAVRVIVRRARECEIVFIDDAFRATAVYAQRAQK